MLMQPPTRERSTSDTAQAVLDGNQWIQKFVENALIGAQMGNATLEAYRLDVCSLQRWAAQRGKSLVMLGPDDLRAYLHERHRAGCHASTLARHLSSFRRFYAFLSQRGVNGANPALRVRPPSVIRQPSALISPGAVAALLNPRSSTPATAQQAYRGARDHAVICLLYGTRLPVSAIRRLRWENVTHQGDQLNVSDGSGKMTCHPLSGMAMEAMHRLRGLSDMIFLGVVDNEYCFATTTGGPMTRQAFGYLVRRVADEAGVVEPVTPSAIRRAGMARNGWPVGGCK